MSNLAFQPPVRQQLARGRASSFNNNNYPDRGRPATRYHPLLGEGGRRGIRVVHRRAVKACNVSRVDEQPRAGVQVNIRCYRGTCGFHDCVCGSKFCGQGDGQCFHAIVNSRTYRRAGSELAELREFWDYLMNIAKQGLGDDFTAALVFYEGRGQELPSGTPGDPAMDFQSSGRRGTGVCGLFQPGSFQPYEMCPAPGRPPSNGVVRGCCRHFAYCVPYSRFALATIDRQSTVILSPRITQLTPQTWKAILTHEAGHCIDFYVTGSDYGLYDHQEQVLPQLLPSLRSIARGTKDAEVRADDMANAVFSAALGRKICYSADTTLQQLTEPGTACATGSEDGFEGELLEHFPHPPAQS